MTNEALRAVINQHTCVIAGVNYQFRLEWWAKEKYVDPVLARNLLNVECVATTEEAKEYVQLHLLVWVTDVSELPAILDDALFVHLAHSGIPHSSETARHDQRTPVRLHRGISSGEAIH